MQPAKSDLNSRMKERRHRRHPRYRADFKVAVTHLRDDKYEQLGGHSRDLSWGGIGMILATDLEIGEVAGLAFSIPELNEPWEVRAVVRHRRGYHYGFEFLTIAERQRLALQGHLSALEPID